MDVGAAERDAAEPGTTEIDLAQASTREITIGELSEPDVNTAQVCTAEVSAGFDNVAVRLHGIPPSQQKRSAWRPRSGQFP